MLIYFYISLVLQKNIQNFRESAANNNNFIENGKFQLYTENYLNFLFTENFTDL